MNIHAQADINDELRRSQLEREIGIRVEKVRLAMNNKALTRMAEGFIRLGVKLGEDYAAVEFSRG